MQKSPRRKLALSKETLRALSPIHLADVEGGIPGTSRYCSDPTLTDTCYHCQSQISACGGC